MSQKKLRYGKLLITGIIWVPLYLDLLDRICNCFLGFSPLTRTDWQDRARDFFSAKWIIHTGQDWLIFMSMLLFIPIMFIGWYICYKIQWRRLLGRKKVKLPQKGDNAFIPQKRTFEPTKLRVQSGAVLSVNPAAPTPGPDKVQAPNRPSAPRQPAFEDEAEVQQVLAQTTNIPADFFPHVNLDGSYASFALSTEKKAAVFRIINRPESTLAVDTDVDITESDWFYEAGSIKAPAKDIIAIAQNLHENEPDSVALPAILFMGGTLLNIDETLAYFEKHNVLLLRTDAVDAESIPLFSDFLQEYFQKEDAPVEGNTEGSDTPEEPNEQTQLSDEVS